MRRKKRPNRTVSQEEKRLFVEANAAWDRKELRQAFGLFLQGAELGDESSQLDLGYFYDNGLSVKKDKKKALEWYHKAYLQGSASAANNIATIYRDLGETWKMLWWFRRAAAMGHIDVLLELGNCYEKGLAVPKDLVKAKQFYRRVLEHRSSIQEDKDEAKARLDSLPEGSGELRKR